MKYLAELEDLQLQMQAKNRTDLIEPISLAEAHNNIRDMFENPHSPDEIVNYVMVMLTSDALEKIDSRFEPTLNILIEMFRWSIDLRFLSKYRLSYSRRKRIETQHQVDLKRELKLCQSSACKYHMPCAVLAPTLMEPDGHRISIN